MARKELDFSPDRKHDEYHEDPKLVAVKPPVVGRPEVIFSELARRCDAGDQGERTYTRTVGSQASSTPLQTHTAHHYTAKTHDRTLEATVDLCATLMLCPSFTPLRSF